MSGRVYLVGAGPGDPGLLTVRAVQVIGRAEVILYDQLVDERVHELFPEKAEKLFVGKEGGTHHVTQEETLRLIVEKAGSGRTVVRLKGGDPFVFGRGGEEAEACADAGIPFEVVPGITAGIACPAYAGIPVTHRDVAASVALITGNRRADREDLDVPAPPADTLVYYMGVKNLPQVTAALLRSGRSPETPVALIHRGTTPAQRTVTGTLATIEALAVESGIAPPAIIVVGSVVGYRERLRWFDNRPLSGVRILITRPRDQAREMREKLEERGAEVISMPAIEIRDLEDSLPIDLAIDRIRSYDYLVFTSVNGVTAFFRRLLARGLDARALGRTATACIGARTALELERFCVRCDLMPQKYVAEALLDIFPRDLAGKRVLIPRALEARDVLPEGLRQRGADVDVVPAYRTDGSEAIAEAPEEIDVALFTSSSAAEHFLRRVELPPGCKVGAIGPITAETLRSLGTSVDFEAEEHTVEGLVDAIEAHWKRGAR